MRFIWGRRRTLCHESEDELRYVSTLWTRYRFLFLF